MIDGPNAQSRSKERDIGSKSKRTEKSPIKGDNSKNQLSNQKIMVKGKSIRDKQAERKTI